MARKPNLLDHLYYHNSWNCIENYDLKSYGAMGMPWLFKRNKLRNKYKKNQLSNKVYVCSSYT